MIEHCMFRNFFMWLFSCISMNSIIVCIFLQMQCASNSIFCDMLCHPWMTVKIVAHLGGGKLSPSGILNIGVFLMITGSCVIILVSLLNHGADLQQGRLTSALALSLWMLSKALGINSHAGLSQFCWCSHGICHAFPWLCLSFLHEQYCLVCLFHLFANRSILG